ncbi:type 1 glutamine amidotransferase [Nakamurella flavida]|uniref:Type 1 glutamine amidotransferase n=1 Tax=Nakamurella flavida TaxID=363630 RepID=A0A938YN57_9ACTN|nr:type 1 glutamine amidotransferase [Nakamurella flavida]MBM9476123.1 type 1 glutamine amidotransferase [Nakamurella flavida]MDP9777132.1 GMP synthase-like glutamine amidotransferase [Nakamurella flavida]
MSTPAPVTVLVLEHDPIDPPGLLADWLVAAGARMDLRRLHAGDPLPDTLEGIDAVVSLGGVMGALDDAVAPWLPATRSLLASATAAHTPTLGICLGAQLLAVANGGTVTVGADGPEIGAHLTAKRDAAEDDPLFADLPMTPDAMQYHYDVVSTLPPGAVLLLSSGGYPHQAFRVGPAAWALQFHIEATADRVREWAAVEGRPVDARLGARLDDAEQVMGEVWPAFVGRFVDQARNAGRFAVPGRRLPLLGPV